MSGTQEVQWETGKHFVSYTAPIAPVSNTGITIWNNRKELKKCPFLGANAHSELNFDVDAMKIKKPKTD